MDDFSKTQTTGSIVTSFPKTAEILKRHKIDFCCGGDRSLEEAADPITAEIVLKELNDAILQTKDRDATIRDLSSLSKIELIEHIQSTHHTYMKKALPELDEYITRVLKAHGINHRELFTVHKLYNSLRTEIEQHLLKEEELLFPSIKADIHDSDILHEITKEHEAAGDILKELRKRTNDYSVPPDGCKTYKIAYEKLEEMENDLFMHIHTENNILFKGM